MSFTLRIGSRPSPLALAQAEMVRRVLEPLIAHARTEIVSVKTTGDKLATAELSRLGGKGLFVKELEAALRDRRIHLAVHSMKDLPARLADGFRIAAVPAREDARDALITRSSGGLDALAPGARLGTSSARRRFEALRRRPDLQITRLRGNVDTRMGRVMNGELDATILAVAGLRRLGRSGLGHVEPLDETDFIPAAGQGALALESLDGGPVGDSEEVERAVKGLDDWRASVETAAERAFLAAIGASCASAVGAKATASDGRLRLATLIFSADGARWLTESGQGALPDGVAGAETLGRAVGERILALGAAELLRTEETL